MILEELCFLFCKNTLQARDDKTKKLLVDFCRKRCASVSCYQLLA